MTDDRKSSTRKSKISILIGIALLIAAIAGFFAVYRIFGAKPTAGSKTVSIEVINQERESAVYEVKTEAEYLKQAMEEADGLTFEGTQSEYGLMVDTVNGETADTAEGAYWAFYINGEYCNYGIETQPVADGDEFLIEYSFFN